MGINAPRGEKPRTKIQRLADWVVVVSVVVAFSLALTAGLESCQQRVLEIVRQ